ncbi:MAG: tRNA lysidine(34) synthetase TilS [Alcaligenaceae bacterium]|nr:tRNA lysidine(34) synthetase TilS [Alcaligenaceae bacterium]
MAASLRKPNPLSSDIYPQLVSFYEAKETTVLTKALVTLLASLQTSISTQGSADKLKIAIGLSGGADSSMLLATLAPLVRQFSLSLHIIHIHHGLMADADAWAEHCQSLAAYFGFQCEVLRVEVEPQSGLGEEAAARVARYQAYSDYCQIHAIQHFILAHHLNDQAETLLLRLLRGTGVKGMTGMLSAHLYGGVTYHRPWLTIDRKLITEAATVFTGLSGFTMIRDPSNLDLRYKRAAVRRLLIPGLDQAWPQWKQTLSRHAGLMSEAQELLDELAESDLQELDLKDEGRSFCLASWRQLSERRQANVLRYWLALHGVQMPTERRINDWLRQLREVHQLGFDRSLSLQHQRWRIVVMRGRVCLSLN